MNFSFSGESRSPTICFGYLIQVFKMSYESAQKLILLKRPKAEIKGCISQENSNVKYIGFARQLGLIEAEIQSKMTMEETPEDKEEEEILQRLQELP